MPDVSGVAAPAKEASRYHFGYLLGTVDQNFLNDLYNVADFINKTAFFGMLGWFYILKEIFMGEAGGVAGECSLPRGSQSLPCLTCPRPSSQLHISTGLTTKEQID